jgi:uncharacterized protein (TIGR02722 family)
MKTTAATMAAIAAVALAGCENQNWRVHRVDPQTQTDVDYRFNDNDAQEALAWLSADCLSRPWVDNFMRENGGRQPIIFLGNIRNNTQDYINTQLYTTNFQRELLNSGRVRVKAERDLRPELRDERLDTKYNDPATLKAVAKELNADFALVGAVNDNKQRSNDGRTVVNFYQFDMQLVNVETAEKVWIQTKAVKKVATR